MPTPHPGDSTGLRLKPTFSLWGWSPCSPHTEVGTAQPLPLPAGAESRGSPGEEAGTAAADPVAAPRQLAPFSRPTASLAASPANPGWAMGPARLLWCAGDELSDRPVPASPPPGFHHSPGSSECQKTGAPLGRVLDQERRVWCTNTAAASPVLQARVPVPVVVTDLMPHPRFPPGLTPLSLLSFPGTPSWTTYTHSLV